RLLVPRLRHRRLHPRPLRHLRPARPLTAGVYFLRFATFAGFLATFAARFPDATRTERAGLAVRVDALAAGGWARTTGFLAASLASFFSFFPILEFGAMPSPSAASGRPGMFLRLC